MLSKCAAGPRLSFGQHVRLRRDRALRRVATVAIAAISLLAGSSFAGNMSLTLSGFTAPIEVVSFNFSATKQAVTTGSGPTIAIFNEVNFAAPESAATPLAFAKLVGAQPLTIAQFQLLSPATAQPSSDWTFTGVAIKSLQVSHDSSSGSFPRTTFSLSFNKVAYRKFAADGSVAQQMCWDVVANAAC